MAIALTAWLIAPAPIACTSTRPLLRITPAMAAATATGLEVAETFSTSTGTRSVIAGTPSRMFSIDSLDRCGPTGGTINGNQYRIECHGPGGDREAVRHARQEELKHHVFVHDDAPVPGPDHPDVGHIGRATRENPAVCRRDVRVGADDGAHAAVEIPAHGCLLGGCFSVHVAEDDLYVRVSRQDRISRPEGVVQGFDEDPPHQVHNEDLVAVDF